MFFDVCQVMIFANTANIITIIDRNYEEIFKFSSCLEDITNAIIIS
jgi:hypothetical protein